MNNYMVTFSCTSAIGEGLDTHSILVTAPTIEDAEDIVRYSSLWKDVHIFHYSLYSTHLDKYYYYTYHEDYCMDNFMITFSCTSAIGEGVSDTRSIIVTAPTIENAEDIVRYSSLWKDVHIVSSIPYDGNPHNNKFHHWIDGSEYDLADDDYIM